MYSNHFSSDQNTSAPKPGIIWHGKEPLLLISISLFMLAGLLGLLMTGGVRSTHPATVILEVLMGLILLGLVFYSPIVGLSLTVTSTALVEVLPSIPLLSSVVPLIGVVTLVAYFAKTRRGEATKGSLSVANVEWLAFLFILWSIIPHLSHGFSSWFLTLFQLWMLAWLTRRLMKTERDYLIVASIFAGGVLISASIAIVQTQIGVFNLAQRAQGLTGGANTASRYFVYGIILLGFLQSRATARFLPRLLALAAVGVLLIATINTVSRSGILILGVAIVLLSSRLLVGGQRTIMLWLILLVGSTWVLKDISGTVLDPVRIIDSILLGTDTMGLRYDLWKSGWQMWLDHPITGVGLGRFDDYLYAYWPVPHPLRVLTPHNTYIQILAETGLVGFIFFSLMIAITIKNFKSRTHAENPRYALASWTWMVVLITLLVGAFTKTEVADKLLWFIVGLSASDPWT